MPRQRSVIQSLKRGLGLVAVGGSLLLVASVAFFYWQWISALPPHQATTRAMQEMLEHVVLPLVLLLVPMMLVGQKVIGDAFRPLEEAAARIEMVSGHERGFRIDSSLMPAEALPFVHAVNDLLSRLDEAARQHEAFAADVAHELRTPLALLSLELDRLHGADAYNLKRDLAAMRRLIDQLMLLAQLDADSAAHIALQPVSLADVAGEVVSAAAPGIIAAGKMIALETGSQPAVVPGRREAIASALRNLVDNAARVTPDTGTIEVFIGPGAVVGVRDGGPGLSPERLRDLVRRHRRADHASVDGAGLGLAIVEKIMVAHGGTLSTSPEKRELQLHFPTG